MIKCFFVLIILFSCDKRVYLECKLSEVKLNSEMEQISKLSLVPPFTSIKMPSFQSDYIMYGSIEIESKKRKSYFAIEFTKDAYFFIVDENLNQNLADDEVKQFDSKHKIENVLRINGEKLPIVSYLIIEKDQKYKVKTIFKNIHVGRYSYGFLNYTISVVDQNIDGKYNTIGDLLIIERKFSETQKINFQETNKNTVYISGQKYNVSTDSSGTIVQFILSEK